MLNTGLFQISSKISVTLVSVPWILIHVIVKNPCLHRISERGRGGGGGGGGGGGSVPLREGAEGNALSSPSAHGVWGRAPELG